MMIKRTAGIIFILTLTFFTLFGCKESGTDGAETVEILSGNRIEMTVGDTLTLSVSAPSGVVWSSSDDCVSVTEGGRVTAESAGRAFITASAGELSDSILIEVSAGAITLDPYEGVDEYEFYLDYEPATSYMDAYFRSLHGFMSGSLEEQHQAPTEAEYKPTLDGLYVKNSAMCYSDDGNTYYVLDSYGEIVNVIYRSGAYVTLEEVAAYVMAFGDVPANYVSNKNARPSASIWGEYLRLNHSQFSGSTTKYPYEPELPNISGCGGVLQYYEIDIGTTGTDCDPSYPSVIYNDGQRITRGAARIVYARAYTYGGSIKGAADKFVFYTYNHYNDFQEYLNYEGGWGEMFGNITGGGAISSKYDYNPTPYVRVALADIRNPNEAIPAAFYIRPKDYTEAVLTLISYKVAA